MRKLFTIMLLVPLLLAACGGEEPAAEQEAISISLPMGYIADPQYAPFYVALDKGYFAEEGFEVEFDYSFETNGVEVVAAGNQPFAIVSGDVVLSARAQDIPVVYVMEWFQQYPIALVSKSAAGISSPEDLIGREVGLPFFFGATYLGYAGLLDANGLTQDDVNATEVGFTQVEALLTDQVEAVMVYVNNEPIQLEAQGEDIQVISVSDYIDMVANGIITSESFAAENPERVRGFVRAVLRGVEDTLNDPDEAYEISKEYVEGLEDDRRAVLDASLPLWEADQPGYTDSASWETTQDILLASGLLDGPVDNLADAYSNEFLPE